MIVPAIASATANCAVVKMSDSTKPVTTVPIAEPMMFAR